MAVAMWQPGRRLFSTAAVFMILTAVAHTAGNLLTSAPDPAQQTLFTAMSGFHVPLGLGMSPSVEDIYWELVFTMSIAFAAIGLLNLVAAGTRSVPDDLLRRFSWVNVVWVGAFIILSYRYQIPPSLISGGIIELLVLASLLVPSARR